MTALWMFDEVEQLKFHVHTLDDIAELTDEAFAIFMAMLTDWPRVKAYED